ncbi:MAG: hypothetical protein ACREON_11995 [Gemmatimonadaceae bacterium]
MIRSSPLLEAFEAHYKREAYRRLTYEQALDVFLALWDEACVLNPDLGSDWLDDVQCDIAIARTLNGLP